MGAGMGLTQEQRDNATAAAVLRHPLRVRILEVLNERDMSPAQFLKQGLAPSGSFGLSHISHHFRELADYGCIKVVKKVPVRGSVEHIYRGKARAYFTDDEWARLSSADRRRITKTMLQGLMARADGAIMADTFDSRLDRHLTWVAMELDERGWSELTAALSGVFAEVEQIRHDAAERLAASGEKAIPATFGMLAFESPPAVGGATAD
jgi:hypothetical protein